MLKKTGRIYLLLFFLVSHSALAEDVTVEATVNADEIGLNDTLIYTLTITCGFNAEPSQIKFPDFQGFRKLSQSQSSSMNIVIGGSQTFSKVRTYDIQLLPNKTGLIEIKPATVIIRGKVYQTRSIKVNVLNASKSTASSQKQRSLKNIFRSPFDIDELPFEPKIDDDDIVLQAVTDKKSVYVGEEIVFSVYLYTAVQVYDIEQFTLPKFENAWTEDIYSPQKFTSEQKRVGQKVYNVYLLKRKAIFPNKAGIFEVEPSSIVLNVVSGFSQKRITRQTQSIKIDVKSLPEKEMPSDFPPYNVGDYKISFSLTPERQPMDKPFTLRINVEGVGNINAFQITKLKDNPELRFYDPLSNTEIQTENRVYKGKKSFEYLIFAKRTGRIQIPSFEIMYFKPDTSSFEKVPVSGLVIEATEPESSESIVKRSIGNSISEKPASIRFINNTGSGFQGLGLNLFIMLSLLFPGLYLVILSRDVFKNIFIYLGFDSETARSRRRLRRLVNKIRRDYKDRNVTEFPGDLYAALSELIYIRFGVNIRGMTRENLRASLREKNAGEDLIQEIEQILDMCEMIRFAKIGAGENEIENLFNRFSSVMRGCGE
ncbi:MAG: BatD family protein [Deltaproteobacteria bacterium]|nr:BatD family protein [Deltaproteobacteria bacterium]